MNSGGGLKISNRYLKKPAGTYQRYRFDAELGIFPILFHERGKMASNRHRPMLLEAAELNRGLGLGKVPKQPKASPTLEELL